MDMEAADKIQLLSAAVIPVLFAIVLHEVAHGWVARLFGDRTAEMLGRLTINPVKHIDPMGTILVPLILTWLNLPAFGWARPIPVSARNLRNPKRDMLYVAAAGPASNVLMALFWTALFAVVLHGSLPLGAGRQFMLAMVQIGITFNILLCIFNLIPIPPLDGGRVLRGLVPESLGRRLDAIEPYGFIILVALLATGIGGSIVWPLVQQASRAFYAMAGASF